MAYYKPEELQNIKKGLEWAKKNPSDPKSIEIQNRLKSGQLNFELKALGLKEVPIQRPKITMPEMPKAGEMSSTQPKGIKEMGMDVLETGVNVGSTISEGAQSIQDIAGNDDLNLPQKAMGVLGSLFGTGAKTIGDVATGVGKLALTQDAEDQLKSFVEEKAQGIAETETAKKLVDWYANLTPENKLIVDSAGGFASLVAEVVGGGTASRVATPVKEGLETALDTTIDVTKRGFEQTSDTVSDLFKTSQKSLENKVQSAFETGVKPNLQGYKTLGEAENYRKSITDAVKTIEQNKGSLQFLDDAGQPIVGRTPESLQEFTEAIDQTKKSIYKAYDDLATQAGEQGVKIDTIKIANELDQVINNKALKLSNPEAVKYAEEVRSRFIKAGELDAKTAQDIIQNYNNSLKAFYRNPTPEGLTKNAVDALMANQMRQALDEGIEGLTGAQYQSLKSQYGALKTVERDVLRATLRDARKNAKGLIDYTDIFSGGQLVSGLLTLNPGMIATGAAQKGIAEWFKFLNDPNRAIKQMFEAGSKLDQEPGSVPIPTRKQLNAPEEGAANTSIYTPMQLPNRVQSTIDAAERANPNIKPPSFNSGATPQTNTANAITAVQRNAPANPAKREVELRDYAKKINTDYDALVSKVEEKLNRADSWKKYADSEAEKIVNVVPNTTLAKAPLKSKERIIEKTLLEESGNLDNIKDIARNTIVPSTPKARLEVLKKMDARKDLARPRKDQRPKDFMGYEGAIYNIKTPDGQIIETQVVSPEMTYGKNLPEFSKSVLGEDVFNAIQKRTGLKPGQGHEYYEQWRTMSLADRLGEKGQELQKLSLDYYNALR